MNNVIITIGREFGSGGRVIGEALAKRLGFSFYDKELIELAAEKSGIHAEVLRSADEIPNAPFSTPLVPTSQDPGTINDRLFQCQKEIILDIASKESCVIVGRCADYILRDFPNCIRIFIYADMDYKIKLVMERHNLKDRELIEKIIRRTDKNRRTYYEYHTDHKWGSREDVDLLIDSSLLGVEGTIALLEKAAQIKKEQLQ